MTMLSPPEPRTPGEKETATIIAFTAHARSVPSSAREAFAAELAALEPSEAMIVVRTCHRVELYVAAGSLGAQPLPDLPAGARRLEGAAAAKHLISVACGLDSAVLGEHQILHQIRETLNARHDGYPLDPILDRLFQVALQAGRRAHSWLSGAPRSLGDVAVERTLLTPASDPGLPILVVGAGIMGKLSAQAAARRGKAVIVTNRTAEKAATLAHAVGGQAIPYGTEGALPQVAGVIVALAARWQLCPEAARQLVDSGVTVVDLSSPPAVTDDLQRQLGDRFVSADDLASDEGGELKDALRNRLEQLALESGREFCRWLRARESVPAIRAVAEAAERQRQDELEWLLHRMPDLSEDERRLIEQMSNRLVAGILHAPRTALNADSSGTLSQAARELFGV
jgi:glutamyl-tRNA reductase